MFPNGWKTLKPYLRVVPQPKSNSRDASRSSRFSSRSTPTCSRRRTRIGATSRRPPRVRARCRRRRADARLVVFPEVAGHLALLRARAAARAHSAKTLAGALAAAAVRRPFDVLRGVATTRLLDARHAVLAALAPDGERWWKSVFGPLAKQHRRVHRRGLAPAARRRRRADERVAAVRSRRTAARDDRQGQPRRPASRTARAAALALHRGDAERPDRRHAVRQARDADRLRRLSASRTRRTSGSSRSGRGSPSAAGSTSSRTRGEPVAVARARRATASRGAWLAAQLRETRSRSSA